MRVVCGGAPHRGASNLRLYLLHPTWGRPLVAVVEQPAGPRCRTAVMYTSFAAFTTVKGVQQARKLAKLGRERTFILASS